MCTKEYNILTANLQGLRLMCLEVVHELYPRFGIIPATKENYEIQQPTQRRLR